MKFKRLLLECVLVEGAVMAVLLIGIHTYSPFGDESRHLNNFDSVVHGGFPMWIGLAYALWRHRKQGAAEGTK